MFSGYVPGSSFVLTRFDGYYGGPAPVATINYSIIKDDETAAIALQNGEVDVVMRQRSDERIAELARGRVPDVLPRGLRDQLEDVQPRGPGAGRPAGPAGVGARGGLGRPSGPRSRRCRPRRRPTSCRRGWTSPPRTSRPTPTTRSGPRALLAEAGYPDGITVTQLGRTSDGITQEDQLEQAYLSEVGINLEFELVDTAVNNERRNAGDFEVAGRLLPAINPDTILFSYLAPENIAPGRAQRLALRQPGAVRHAAAVRGPRWTRHSARSCTPRCSAW